MKSGQYRMLVGRKASVYFVCALFSGATLMSCGKEEKKAASEVKPLQVKVADIQTSGRSKELTLSGSIEVVNEVKVGFALPGVVNEVLVQEGQKVGKGQLLASIDDTEFANALIIADAGLEQAEDMFKRLDELYGKGSLPAKDYIEIKSKVAQARANKNISAKHIADSKLRAPMSGVVVSRMIEPGSTAAPGVPAFSIVRTDLLYAKATVPESQIGAVKVGSSAGVYIPTLSETVSGTIAIINPVADPVTRSYSVKIKVTNTGGRILPGMIADVKIPTSGQVETVTIPAQTVKRDVDGTSFVYLVQGQKAVQRRVDLGKALGQNEVAVLSGLNTGDKLVVSGYKDLRDGAAVTF